MNVDNSLTANIRLRDAPRMSRALLILMGVLVVVIVFATPYLWLIVSTFKTREDLFADMYPFSWRVFIPVAPTLENFRTLFLEYDFYIPVLNSLGLALAAVIISTFLNSMMAFVLSWLKFPGRRLVFFTILATLLVAFEAKIVPLFIIVQRLNLYNTYLAILIPWITDAYFIFLLRQHFLDLPKDLFDAATVDGSSYFRTFWSVMLPNIKPGLISAMFIKFIFTWDSFIWPLIAVRDESKKVINVAIAGFFTDDYVLWELVFAGSFVATIPVIIVFFFLQRYYVQGFVTSGLKG